MTKVSSHGLGPKERELIRDIISQMKDKRVKSLV